MDIIIKRYLSIYKYHKNIMDFYLEWNINFETVIKFDYQLFF